MTGAALQVSPALHGQHCPAAEPAAQYAGSRGSAAGSATGSAFMVQIAAVSHQEDADVLVGALRRRGYAVAAHRDPHGRI